MGYQVFAVEGVRLAIEALSEESDIQLQFHEQDSTYRSSCGRLQIYFGDLFTCPIETWAPFDYVWDKGSLTAIDEEQRNCYAGVLQRSLLFPGTANCA